MNIYQEIRPTYLYIKQHSITGKLYFGKTIKDDPIKYMGSGKHWKSHINKHGKEFVETLWYCLFHDKESIIKFAETFSEQQDIVKSNIWLNLVKENGIDGTTIGIKWYNNGNISYRFEDDNVPSGWKLGRVYDWDTKISSKDKIWINDDKVEMYIHKDIGIPETFSVGRLYHKRENTIMICPHCNMHNTPGNHKRYHGDICKSKILIA